MQQEKILGKSPISFGTNCEETDIEQALSESSTYTLADDLSDFVDSEKDNQSKSGTGKIQFQFEDDHDSELERPIQRLKALLRSCTCTQRCIEKADPSTWMTWLCHHDELLKKDKKTRITYLLSPHISYLQVPSDTIDVQPPQSAPQKIEKRKMIYQLPFVKTVCRAVFTTFWNISLKELYALIHHLQQTQIPISKLHGNKNRKPHNILSPEVVAKTTEYLLQLMHDEGEAIAT
ncbi:hypothetical protein HOY82DRAFT_538666 [Tuber indicum]|nr:hypothetical protein HOY82DRAFT_538666 [Tuber indicum]